MGWGREQVNAGEEAASWPLYPAFLQGQASHLERVKVAKV